MWRFVYLIIINDLHIFQLTRDESAPQVVSPSLHTSVASDSTSEPGTAAQEANHGNQILETERRNCLLVVENINKLINKCISVEKLNDIEKQLRDVACSLKPKKPPRKSRARSLDVFVDVSLP